MQLIHRFLPISISLLAASLLSAATFNEGEAPFAINGADVPPIKESGKLYEPQLKGPWQTMFFPNNATYMNDHSVYRHTDGSWHIIGIGNDIPSKSFPNPYQREVQFVHGVSDSLLGPYKDLPPVSRHPYKKGMPKQGLKKKPKTFYAAWAPHTIRYNKECWIFYAPHHLFIEKSADMKNWEIVNHFMNDLPVKGPSDITGFDYKNGGAEIRDYMILRVSETQWLLYYTSIDKATKAGSVTVLESKNGLTNWEYKGEAVTFQGLYTKPWSSAESPFVFKRGDFFYLTLTYTSTGGGYHQTLMFRSKDPYQFGNYNGEQERSAENTADFVAGLGAHAPEIIYDPDADKWYITSCGWSWDRVVKPPQSAGGLAIAELEWKEQGTFLRNHDFEYGALQHWKKEDDAFNLSVANFVHEDQPIDQNGSFFISSVFYESSKDLTFKKGGYEENARTGKLTSDSFTLSQSPTMDFLIMGGNDAEKLYIALVDDASGKVLAKATGNGTNRFERKTLDISRFAGRKCRIHIVDTSTELNGHLSVDDINITLTPIRN